MIIGKDQQIVTVILHLLSYFIRCSEVFEQSVEQSPKNLTSYLNSLETQSEACDLDKEINTQVNSKCDTISEEFPTEFARPTKDFKLKKCSNVSSQNSKKNLENTRVAFKNAKVVSNIEFENCEISQSSEKISELSKNCQMLTTTETVDSCGEDSGVCSAEFDSSVEIPKNYCKICINGFLECSKGPQNCENSSQNCENCSQNSAMCTKISENCSQDVDIYLKDSRTLVTDSKRCPQDSENCVQNSTIFESDVGSGSSNHNKCISKKIEKKLESNCTEDEICECDKILEKTSTGVMNTEICSCNGLFSGNSKEHKLWKSFLKSSCCNRNSRSLDRRSFSTDSMDQNSTKPVRRCSSEKSSELSRSSKLCIQNNGEILSLDRQSILNMFRSSYPLCPICKGQLNFVDQDFAKDSKNLENVCLCQDCDKVKSCSCQVIETGLGENARCASSTTVNSDEYSSGISSFEGERCSLSSLSVDSGLNEHCLQSSENLVGECGAEDQAFTLELPEAQ